VQSSSNLINGEVGNNTFGGGVGDTILGPGVLILGVLAIVLIVLLPRKFVLAPLMFGLFLIPFGQTLVLGGVHLYASRILIAVALIRAVASRQLHTPLFGAGFNSIDKVFILWAILRASAFVLRFQELGAVVNQAGFLWDILGGYLVMRFLIQDDDDGLRAIKILGATAAVISLTVAYEKLYDVNLYAFLANTRIVPEIRNGSIRAQGPFHHAILAGTFGATLLPLFLWLWKRARTRLLGLLGMVAATVIVYTAASSTPVSAGAAAIVAICFWPLRNGMRLIRWGLVIGILMLNFAMHAPVWWAIEHVDFAGGSAGEHRAELVDNFVRHFGDWWLVGTNDNAKWGYEMWDISNQYVAEGEVGGLATFLCFLAMLYLAFKWVGISRKSSAGDRQREWYFWLLGAALFSHSVAFFGISYFDQIRYSWCALLAVICVSIAPLSRRTALATTQSSSEQSAKMLTLVER
jgi:hypothetical protein